ncbi:MAG: class I SAM-dependent methyltransferase [Chloroflexi bacterium]|nr:MAG: class I SAM-dependent methyltransferase [Chloroflexota bacterium]
MLSRVDDPKDIVRRGYDLVSRAYRADDGDDSQYAAWLELVETRVAAGAPVLDLGCGCGVPVARRLAQRYVVTGVDLSITCLYALIHLPLAEQPALLRSVSRWLQPGGLFLATVGHQAWTGLEKDWLGVAGGDMWWSHADASTYRRWFSEAGLAIERETFVPEGAGGHTLLVATR